MRGITAILPAYNEEVVIGAWCFGPGLRRPGTGDDPKADESTDKAGDIVTCRKCGKDALFAKMGEFEDKPVKCYTCPACKTETRKEAS